MKVLLISDSFLPEGNAAAVHMSELQKFLDGQNIETILGTSAAGELDVGYSNLIKIIRTENKFKRSNKFIPRALGEIISAISVGIKLRFQFDSKSLDRIIVYSPSIFWALTLLILNTNPQKVRLLVRDIFPLWLLNAGILKRSSFAFGVLNTIAKLQFMLVGQIFVQSEIDALLIENEYKVDRKKVFLLHTWMDEISHESSPKLDKFVNKQNKNLLWLGNMGLAQNRDFVISIIINALQNDKKIVFNIVGLKEHDRKVLISRLAILTAQQIARVNVIKSLSHLECAQLALRSDLGIFSLGQHTTAGNIPGKFITYIMSGLPVFGICPKDSAIAQLIVNHRLGKSYHGDCPNDGVKSMISILSNDHCRNAVINYFRSNHSTEYAAKKLLE